MVLRRFGKRGNDLVIELDRPGGPYYPGDVVRAAITYGPQKDISVRGIQATLAAWEVYVSEGSNEEQTRRTLTDEAIFSEVLMPGGLVSASSPVSVELNWQIPAEVAPPYNSDSLKCGLSVRVHVDIERGRDVSESVVLPLIVPAPGERVESGTFGEPSNPKQADMELRLSGQELIEGETFTGRLTVMPRESFGVRQVVVVLDRKQVVHARGLKATATQSVAKAKLGGKTQFSAGQAIELPFSLDVPALGCPSRETEQTTVTHTLKGVLGRGLRKNYEVSVPVAVYGGRRA